MRLSAGITMNDELAYRFTEQLSEEERRTLFGWDPDPFRAKAWGLTWRMPTFHVLICSGDQPVSHVGLIRDVVQVGGERIPVGGLGGVVTIPGFQGRGLAQRGLARALQVFAEEWALRHALLFCFPPLLGFYEGLGWQRWTEPVWVAQPEGEIQMPVHTLARSWDGGHWPAGEMKIGGLPW